MANMGESGRYLPRVLVEDLVSVTYKGETHYGIVSDVHGEGSSDESSSSAYEDGSSGGGGGGRGGSQAATTTAAAAAACRTRSRRKTKVLKRGYVRVQWYPKGNRQDVKESKLKLVDRSVIPRDMVHYIALGTDGQCGTVLNVNVYCTLALLGTSDLLFPVNSKDLDAITPFVYGDYVVLDCWLGRVFEVKTQLALQLSNGAQCYMDADDACRLQDVNPHCSDSGVFYEYAGFYTGQRLIGPAQLFASVQWISGVRPVIRKKSKFRAMVVKVEVVQLSVRWITRGYWPSISNTGIQPDDIVPKYQLDRLQRLSLFDHGRMVMGERMMYKVPEDCHIAFGKSEVDFYVWDPFKDDGQFQPKELYMSRIFPSEKVKENQAKDGATSCTTEMASCSATKTAKEVEASAQSLITKMHSFCLELSGIVAKPEQACEMDTSPVFHVATRALDATSRFLTELSQIKVNFESNITKDLVKGNPVDAVDSRPGAKDEPSTTGVSLACNGDTTLDTEARVFDMTNNLSIKDNQASKMLPQTGGRWVDMLDEDDEVKEDDCDDDDDDDDDEEVETGSASSVGSSFLNVRLPFGRRKHFMPTVLKHLKKRRKQKHQTDAIHPVHPGQRLAVEVVHTKTFVDVMWQDGSIAHNVRSNDLGILVHVDEYEYCPGDFVLDKRELEINEDNEEVYGVVSSTDHQGRTCTVCWLRSHDNLPPQVYCHEQDVSVYDLADHPDFFLRQLDIVLRIKRLDVIIPTAEESCVGQVIFLEKHGKISVQWADGSISSVFAQELFKVTSDFEDSDIESLSADSAAEPSEGESDSCDSWETEEEETLEGNGGDLPSSEGAIPHWIVASTRLLEGLKSMTVDHLLSNSNTTAVDTYLATSAQASETSQNLPSVAPAASVSKFCNDVKLLKKTMDSLKTECFTADNDAQLNTPVPHTEPTVSCNIDGNTPVLREQSDAAPGVVLMSAQGEIFTVMESVLDCHIYKTTEFLPLDPKKFFNTIRKEMLLLATSLPEGIRVKAYEDRMDLFTALIKGPERTPYEDGLFIFDIQLPGNYPSSPPSFHFYSFCHGRLNPNLYENGKVCVSLLGTWSGKGTEKWTNKSSLLQVLISIQGLILVNEPYYNEAGFESDRGLQEGFENSRCYNEMVLIKLLQSTALLIRDPHPVFRHEVMDHFRTRGWRLYHRLQGWLSLNQQLQYRATCSTSNTSSCITTECPDAGAVMMGTVGEEETFHSPTASAQAPSASKAFAPTLAVPSSVLAPPPATVTCDSDDETDSGGRVESSAGVRPKKRRKSYHSFLQGRQKYPNVGFPLFPLSKGFIKSVEPCLQQLSSTLQTAGIPDDVEDVSVLSSQSGGPGPTPEAAS